jgi:hypothetical protein
VSPLPTTADELIERLEEASRTLFALRVSGVRPADARSSMPEVIHTFEEAYGWMDVRPRVEAPPAREITRMDEAFGWVGLIPQDRFVLRRVVLLRAMSKPGGDGPMLSWRRIGDKLGASHVAVAQWHAAALSVILDRLAHPCLCWTGGVRSAMRPEDARALVEAAVRRVWATKRTGRPEAGAASASA